MNQVTEKILKGEICPYCKCETELVRGDEIYVQDINTTPRPAYLDKFFYRCKNDKKHYVGTYLDNKTSLGSLANDELREIRSQAHKIFDPLWSKKTHFKNRDAAAKWLSHEMNIPLNLIHFGMFNEGQCREAIQLCKNLIENK